MYSINTDGLPFLRDYTAALKHYNSITPLRGRTVDTRPIGPRRKTSALIWMDGQDVIAQLYQTNVIRYKPDGTIVVDTGRWNTRSTFDYLASIVGIHLFCQSNRLFCRVWRNGIAESIYLGSGHEFEFTRIDGVLMPTLQNTYFVHRINRKAMSAARDIHRSFINYMDRTCRLRQDIPIRAEEFVEAGLLDRGHFDAAGGASAGRWLSFRLSHSSDMLVDLLRVHSKSDDPVDQYTAFLLTPLVNRRPSHPMALHINTEIDVDKATWLRQFDLFLMMTYKESIFDEVPVASGKCTKDRYDWLFS